MTIFDQSTSHLDNKNINNNSNYVTIKSKYNYNRFMTIFQSEYSGNVHKNSNTLKKNDAHYRYQEIYILVGVLDSIYCSDVTYYRDLPYIHNSYSNYDKLKKSFEELNKFFDCVFIFKNGNNITSSFTKYNKLPYGSNKIKHSNKEYKCFNSLFERNKHTGELYITVEEYKKK